MSKVIIGTELKLNVNIQPIDGQTMDDYDFEVQIKGGRNSISFIKRGVGADTTLTNGLKKGDDSSNYIVAFNTQDLGVGRVVCRVIAHLYDNAFDFENHKRTEITEINTGIEVVKSLL